jgi:adenylate kinase family enzyme
LLGDKHFSIATKVVRAFARKQKLRPGDAIVLNGLPRHEGQARALDGIVAVEAVVSLQCSARVAFERIKLNSGGDRTGREDDSVEAIGKKIELFGRQTLPLLEYYRRRAVPIYSIIISTNTSPRKSASS